MVTVYLDFDGWTKEVQIPHQCIDRGVVRVSFEETFVLAGCQHPVKDSFTCYDFRLTNRKINGYLVFIFNTGNPMRVLN